MAKSNSRPDITYPCPDPEKEPRAIEFKKGQRVRVKPNVFFQGQELSEKEGTIVGTESYILLEIQLMEKYTDPAGNEQTGWFPRVFPMLRYEIELIELDLWSSWGKV